jgi:2-polyprenyl-3-methyl-5-hydroxy-6-metoxy-1,4-benzoquinol methylase
MPLAARSTLPELMDAETVDETTYRRCLADLAAINRITFTHRATLNWLTRATKNIPPDAEIAILDVAYGQGDLLRAIAGWAAKRGRAVRLSGIDLNPRSAVAARALTPPGAPITYYTGDVFAFTPASAPDFIVTSQFTHHLADHEIVSLLRWLDATATSGWFITDLHRHALAYYGFPLLAWAMSWHGIVRHDGRISIARGFTRAEWELLVRQAGIQAEITWKLPFRHAISRLK